MCVSGDHADRVFILAKGWMNSVFTFPFIFFSANVCVHIDSVLFLANEFAWEDISVLRHFIAWSIFGIVNCPIQFRGSNRILF